MGENIAQRIQEQYAHMTKKQRALADYMLQNPDEMSFITLRELASATNISEMTILHACAVLGVSNYNELKYEFRKYISERNKEEVQRQGQYAQILVPEGELGDKQALLLQICQEDFDTTRLFYSNLNIDALFQAAQMMLAASNTFFCARGVSVQVAEFLSMRLAILGLPSVLINTELSDSIQSALPLMNRDTLVVAISLPDYYSMTTKVCQFAKNQGSPILGLTDSEHAPVAKLGDLVLTAPSSSRLFVNQPGTMMMLANLLASALTVEKSARKAAGFNSPQAFSKLFQSTTGE